MKISDHLIQAHMPDECHPEILSTKASPINMRLYKINPHYRKVVLEVVKYLDEHLNTKFEDYPEPRGIAATNLGFPLRIIGYKRYPKESQFCLNPKITKRSEYVTTTTTNCGSLRLKEQVSVERHNTITLQYYDLEGILTTKENLNRNEGAFTIQNIVDILDGITIVDRAEMLKKKNNNHVSDM